MKAIYNFQCDFSFFLSYVQSSQQKSQMSVQLLMSSVFILGEVRLNVSSLNFQKMSHFHVTNLTI